MGSGKKYSSEFRAEAVRAVTDRSRPVSSVASELGINAETLRVWVNRAKYAAVDERNSVGSQAEKELRALERRIADLEQENAFLKKAAAFFAATQNQRNGLR